jgi:hypothetical protein
MWMPDILLSIGYFHCRREARYVDVSLNPEHFGAFFLMPVEKSRFLASNWSFLLLLNAQIIFLASNWQILLPS